MVVVCGSCAQQFVVKAGMYAVEARFESKTGRFRVHSDFLVGD